MMDQDSRLLKTNTVVQKEPVREKSDFFSLLVLCGTGEGERDRCACAVPAKPNLPRAVLWPAVAPRGRAAARTWTRRDKCEKVKIFL